MKLFNHSWGDIYPDWSATCRKPGVSHYPQCCSAIEVLVVYYVVTDVFPRLFSDANQAWVIASHQGDGFIIFDNGTVQQVTIGDNIFDQHPVSQDIAELIFFFRITSARFYLRLGKVMASEKTRNVSSHWLRFCLAINGKRTLSRGSPVSWSWCRYVLTQRSNSLANIP